ncbi:hypothetical protein [Flavobacterium sp.]|jgi:hypothetical protein|uniref:hypothetical protein n=1 Tax=Flavobacterium sp. TaxID=239 RepID=UPI0037C1645E
MKNLVLVDCKKMNSFKNLKSLDGRNFILTILLFIATVVSGYSQNSRLMDVNDFLKKSNTEVTKLQGYLTNLNPSVYLVNEVITKKTEKSSCLYTDVKSVKSINTIGLDTKSIEFVSIKINSKNEIVSPIDLSFFSQFPNLKYIVLEFEFEVSQSEAQKSISKASENQSVLYKVEIQS